MNQFGDIQLKHFNWTRSRSVSFFIDHVPDELVQFFGGLPAVTDHDNKRETDAQGNPLATTVGPDPGNTDPAKLVAPLDPDDDVYQLIAAEQKKLADQSSQEPQQ